MQIGEHTPDNLIAGDFPRITAWMNFPTGSIFKRGTVVTYASSPITRYGVLIEDVDATAAALEAPVYLTGEFARDHMITSGGTVLSDADVINLSVQSIFVKKTIAAV